jgi:STE24 endopeptidase
MTVLATVADSAVVQQVYTVAEGSLRETAKQGLAERTQFRAQSIQVMDGSRRSAHSNAFFIGFGDSAKLCF